MTVPAPGLRAGEAIIDGIDIDAVAAVVRGCPGVSGLEGGQYGDVTTYLPGRTVRGVTAGGGRVRVQIRSAWGTQAPLLAAAITAALAPLTGDRPVDVLIADIDDPPVTPARPSRRAGHAPANRGLAPA